MAQALCQTPTTTNDPGALAGAGGADEGGSHETNNKLRGNFLSTLRWKEQNHFLVGTARLTYGEFFPVFTRGGTLLGSGI